MSTSHEECWHILTGLHSLILDPISCGLVSSAVRCRLLTATLRLPSPTRFRGFLFPTPLWRSFPVTSRSRAQALVWFRAKTDKGIVCLADHPHSATRTNKRIIFKSILCLFCNTWKHLTILHCGFTWTQNFLKIKLPTNYLLSNHICITI